MFLDQIQQANFMHSEGIAYRENAKSWTAERWPFVSIDNMKDVSYEYFYCIEIEKLIYPFRIYIYLDNWRVDKFLSPEQTDNVSDVYM